MRRVLLVTLAALATVLVPAVRADAITVRDLVELSKAGLSDDVLIALIDVDHTIFTLDAATIKQLKDGGVSDAVIVAAIRSGRTRPQAPQPAAIAAPPVPAAETPRPEPQVIVVDHHDSQPAAAAPVAYPVAVPVYVPVESQRRSLGDRSIRTVISTDEGLVRARVPVPANCLPAQPVYWGFGGKLRPGSWEPQPTVVCR